MLIMPIFTYKIYYDSHESYVNDQEQNNNICNEYIKQYPIEAILPLNIIKFRDFLVETRIKLYNLHNNGIRIENERIMMEAKTKNRCINCSIIHFIYYQCHSKTNTLHGI